MIKLLFTAVAVLVMVTASAKSDQTRVKDSIMDHLKKEGYVPEIDDDGDIALKVSGTGHYIRVYDDDDGGFTYVELFCIYNSEETTLDKVSRVANNTNQSYKHVRVTYTEDEDTDGGSFRILFETPSFVADAGEFNDRLKEYIDCIEESSDYFFEELGGEE